MNDDGVVDEALSNAEQLEPELQEYARQFSANRRSAGLLLEGLTERQLTWHDGAGTWSIIDCLNHLATTANESLPRIRSAITDARSRGLLSTGPFRHPIAGNILIRLMDAPPRIRFKAPKAYRPTRNLSVSETLAAYFLVQEELPRVLKDANGLDLARVRVTNPVISWWKLSLGQEFAFDAAHERRHLWQASQVRTKLLTTGVAA